MRAEEQPRTPPAREMERRDGCASPRPALASLPLAVLLWGVAFSWRPVNFWLLLAVAVALLTAIALAVRGTALWRERLRTSDVAVGGVSAAVLWGVFWVGDRLATALFPFAPQQVAAVYALRDVANPWVIGALLVLLIGPGEEVYWRGLVQWALARRYGPLRGWLLGTAAFAGAHLVSLNPMVVLAATVAGASWGWLYFRFGRLWPCVLSHLLWDLAIFLLFPVR